jgi:exopolyphosphatase/guanosine-5'-triphosphate,3'-diphosphate pyrophosphatase
MKLASIDIGSNAIRLLICNIVEDKNQKISYKKISLTRLPIRLGADVFTKQKISDKAQKRLIHGMKAYRYLMKVHGVTQYRACATSAFRDAQNGSDVIKKVWEKSGIKIDLISGEEEARIIYSSHIEKLLKDNTNILYVDVGGGSTELSLFINKKLEASKSFQIGTVRLLQNTVPQKTWEEMQSWLLTVLKKRNIDYIVGSGGNINKLVKISNDLNKKVSSEIKIADLDKILKKLKSLTYEERISEMGLNPDRADVIVPATEIFMSLLQWGNIPKVLVPKFGLSDGLIIEMHTNPNFQSYFID